jgi:hypothetical protein
MCYMRTQENRKTPYSPQIQTKFRLGTCNVEVCIVTTTPMFTTCVRWIWDLFWNASNLNWSSIRSKLTAVPPTTPTWWHAEVLLVRHVLDRWQNCTLQSHRSILEKWWWESIQFQIAPVDIPSEHINIPVHTGYLVSTCYMFSIDPSGRESNGYGCGRPLPEIRGLNPAEGMDGFLLCMSRVTHVEASATSWSLE